jgi:hypothetical protein
VKFIENGFRFLKRVLRGNYKPDLIEVSIVGNVICYDKVAYMNGVKRAEI